MLKFVSWFLVYFLVNLTGKLVSKQPNTVVITVSLSYPALHICNWTSSEAPDMRQLRFWELCVGNAGKKDPWIFPSDHNWSTNGRTSLSYFLSLSWSLFAGKWRETNLGGTSQNHWKTGTFQCYSIGWGRNRRCCGYCGPSCPGTSCFAIPAQLCSFQLPNNILPSYSKTSSHSVVAKNPSLAVA